jgi:Mannosyltransferase (PIG-V)
MSLRSIAARVARTARTADTRPFWTFVWIRLAFWFGTTLTLLWSPPRQNVPYFRAYDAHSDLLFGTFAQWDTGWFIRIAERGYDVKETSAFFPVYPLVVRGLAFLIGSHLVAGVLISLVAAGIACVLLVELARPVLGERGAADAVLYLSLYPLALVFTSLYAEGLFLALSVGSFLAATRGRAWVAGVCGGLAVATRLVGLALAPALLLLLLRRNATRREQLGPIAVLLLPAALLGYRLYLRAHFGDSNAFTHVLALHWYRKTPRLGPVDGLWDAVAAGWDGAVTLVRHVPRMSGYPGGLTQADQLAAWNVVHLLLLIAVLWLTWVAWRRLGWVLGLYAATVDVALLSSVVNRFPLQSVPRYAMLNFPLFLALAAVTQTRPRLRQVLLIGFGAVGTAAAIAFSRDVWVA